jgi:uncharacterized membrane protein SpoIIM required for sporulation
LIDNIFKKYLIIVSIIFIITFILSIFIFPSIYQIQTPKNKDTVRILSITPPSEFFKTILINNIVVSFIILASGVTGLEAIPIIFMIYNAFYLGELIAVVNKPDTYMMIYAMTPHSIIELPTLILVTTFGCYLAYKLRETTKTRHMIEYLRKRNVNINSTIYNYGIKRYILIILPLIIIGCIIESGISLYILRYIFNGS